MIINIKNSIRSYENKTITTIFLVLFIGKSWVCTITSQKKLRRNDRSVIRTFYIFKTKATNLLIENPIRDARFHPL